MYLISSQNHYDYASLTQTKKKNITSFTSPQDSFICVVLYRLRCIVSTFCTGQTNMKDAVATEVIYKEINRTKLYVKKQFICEKNKHVYGVLFSSEGRAGVPRTEALTSVRRLQTRVPAWSPLLHVTPPSLSTCFLS